MKKAKLTQDKQLILAEYVQSLTTTSVGYDFRGKYIDGVYRFLESAEEVSKWSFFKKQIKQRFDYDSKRTDRDSECR